MTASEIIARLQLQPHPVEGGFFRETYRSTTTIPASVLPAYPAARSTSTAIYYLLTPTTVSAMHCLPGDEVFHFYMGDPVEMLQLWPDGSHRVLNLGTDLAAGQVPQLVVPGGVWQGSRLRAGGSFALLGATMAPGFDYADYADGHGTDLAARYPAVAALITELLP